MLNRNLILFIFIFSSFKIFSENPEINFCDSSNLIFQTKTIQISHAEILNKKPNPILLFFKKIQKRNRKITAALLAFPFPFGIVGLHRIYLGTKPWVPVVYIASLGGIFGILPLIDFFVLLADKDSEQYDNNAKIFMWVR